MSLQVRRRTLVRVSAFLVLAVVPCAMVAQGNAPLTQPAAIPTDLAAALIASGGVGGYDAPRILVGSAPEWVAGRIVLPPGASVLGSAFQGTTVVTIVHVPAGGDSVIEKLRKPLLDKGWKQPPAQPFFGGGFRPAPTPASTMAASRLSLCDAGVMLTASFALRDSRAVDIAYRFSSATGFGMCNPPQQPLGMYRSPYPTLYNPAASTDARMTGDCSTTLGMASATSTTLRTGLPQDAVLDHYTKQLADSGWRVEGDRGATVGRIFSRPDSTGTPIELTLTVGPTAKSEGCRDVSMSVRPLKKP